MFELSRRDRDRDRDPPTLEHTHTHTSCEICSTVLEHLQLPYKLAVLYENASDYQQSESILSDASNYDVPA